MSAPKFSLSFSKKIEKKTLLPSAIRNDTPAETKSRTENIESIEENILKTDGKAEEEELVIPMIQADRGEIFRKLAEKREKEAGSENRKNGKEEEEEKKLEAKPLTIDEQAEAAVLEECKKKLDGWTERAAPSNLTITVDQKDSGNDSEIQTDGKESSLDNYDEVNIENFGAALLRGMGWQKAEGIGKRNKQVVNIIDPGSKTFGLIGSKMPGEKGGHEAKPATGEEELVLQKGSFVFIHSGRQRGTYGVIESLDEDHMLVKAAVSQTILREVEFNVRVVSQKEFKDSSRVINKEMYDKYKEEQEKKKEQKKKSKYSDDNDNKDRKDREKGNVRKALKEEETKSDSENSKYKLKRKDVLSEDRSTSRISNKEKSQYEDKGKERLESMGEGGRGESDVTNSEDKEKYRKKVEKTDNQRGNEKSNRETTDKESEYREKYEKESRYQENQERETRYREYEERKGTSREIGERKSKYSEYRKKDNYSTKSKSELNREDCTKYKKGSDSGGSHKRPKYDDYKHDFMKVRKSPDKMPAVPWVRENLRVRLISKDYKGGKYHKEKVTVMNVITAESCECVTAGGDILRKVHPDWLETVIPKIPPQIIMIVKGQLTGQKGQILQLHKDQEKASVQLLEDETVIKKLHYDDICEYV